MKKIIKTKESRNRFEIISRSTYWPPLIYIIFTRPTAWNNTYLFFLFSQLEISLTRENVNGVHSKFSKRTKSASLLTQGFNRFINNFRCVYFFWITRHWFNENIQFNRIGLTTTVERDRTLVTYIYIDIRISTRKTRNKRF